MRATLRLKQSMTTPATGQSSRTGTTSAATSSATATPCPVSCKDEDDEGDVVEGVAEVRNELAKPEWEIAGTAHHFEIRMSSSAKPGRETLPCCVNHGHAQLVPPC